MDKLAPLRSIDRFQRRHRTLAVAFAVQKKLSDDGGGHLAALIGYYGFVALFPLLLLLVSVLGFVLQGDPGAAATITNSGLKAFPIIGSSLRAGSRLHGSAAGVAIGGAGALLAGLGVTVVAQTMFNQVHSVPHKRRPNFLQARVRGIGLVALVGSVQIITTALAGLVSAGLVGVWLVVAGVAASLACNFAVFFAVFRLLTDRRVKTSELWPGIVLASVGWEALQSVGGIYVKHVLHGATATYGVFATVIGLLAWLFLGARLVVYSAELNSVLARGYWPRSLLGPATPADDAARRALAHIEERDQRETIRVSFEEPGDSAS
ncbi:MAG: YihY/virulence factor BrkB family protein [Solirubrobacteraceae bacterium]|jgi:uncharacterized BrkB/YihY/UPF0761 family membrane protein